MVQEDQISWRRR